MKRRLLLAIVILVIAMALTACQISASAEGDVVTLEEFLTWLLSPIAIGVVLSVILEKVPFAKKYFDKITDPDWRRLTVLGICLAIPLLATAGRAAIGVAPFTADTIFLALAVGWDAFATSQVTHAFIRD